MTTSVVICAYTEARWTDLRAAVASVASQDVPAEIVVVVDHNPGLLSQAADHWNGSDVRVVANANGRGLSGARNTGVAVAAGDIVAFLDDDAVADPGWLANLLAAFETDHVAGAGGHVEAAPDAGVPAWWPAAFNWVVGCSWTGLPDAPSPVRNVIGCNMAFRRHDLLAAGGFTEGVGRIGARPVGCEETDLCIRLKRRDPNAKVIYVPAATVRHRVPADRMRWTYFRRRCFAEGISKAQVARANGAGPALQSERGYVRRVLPRAVVSGPVRAAAAVVAGLLITTAGFGWGCLTVRAPR